MNVVLHTSWAQIEVNDEGEAVKEAPARPREVGKGAAQEYFQQRKKNSNPSTSATQRAPAQGAAPRYLALHIGTYFDEDAYKWGRGDLDDIGKLNAGVSYRIGEWVNSMDLLVRADFSTWDLDEGNALKMSLLPVIVFPDASSKFPLYFGAGAGVGVFFKQIRKESALSFDYQLLLGARFFDVLETMGFFIEAGMKNHIHLLSDGQYNGVFVTIGVLFNF